jgi:hypothetical protein
MVPDHPFNLYLFEYICWLKLDLEWGGYAGVGVLESVSRDTETGDPARTPALGTSDFDTQMCGIKFWKGEDNKTCL